MENLLAFPAGVLAAIFGVVAFKQRGIPLQPVNDTIHAGTDQWIVSLASDHRFVNVNFLPGEGVNTANREELARLHLDCAALKPHTEVRWKDGDSDAARIKASRKKARDTMKAMEDRMGELRELLRGQPDRGRWEIEIASLLSFPLFAIMPAGDALSLFGSGDDLRAAIEDLRAEVEAGCKLTKEQAFSLKEKDEQIAHLQEGFDTSSRMFKEMEAESLEKDSEIVRLQALLDQADAIGRDAFGQPLVQIADAPAPSVDTPGISTVEVETLPVRINYPGARGKERVTRATQSEDKD